MDLRYKFKIKYSKFENFYSESIPFSLVSFTRLCARDTQKVFIRTMMAAGTKLSSIEVVQTKKIISRIFSGLRQGPLDQQGLLSLLDVVPINPKIFQYVITVLFPKVRFCLSTLQKKYPTIKIGASAKDAFDWNDAIAMHSGTVIKRSNFFGSGELYVLGTLPNDRRLMAKVQNTQALENTKQKNPDYYYISKKLGDDTVLWTRYYDLKTGKFSALSGHVIVCSDDIAFEQQVKKIMNAQLNAFKVMGDEYTNFVAFISNLLFDKKIGSCSIIIKHAFKNCHLI